MKIDTKARNLYVYFHLLYYNSEFPDSIASLMTKWDSPYLKNPLGYYSQIQPQKALQAFRGIAIKQRKSYLESLKHDQQRKDFQNDIKFFLERFDFGDEWHESISDLVISFWLDPPAFPFHIYLRGKDQKQRVVLDLDASVERDDLVRAWPIIKLMKRMARPFAKSPKITQRSIDDLSLLIQEKKLSITPQDHLKTDLGKVAEYWKDIEDDSAKADRKRVNVLRAKRHRTKRKLK